jgi:DNA-binding CsgD family transcriptional regulator
MPDEHALLRNTVTQAHRLTGLPVVFAGSVCQAGVVLSEFSGVRTRSLRNLVVAPQRGLGGRALQARKPASVLHYGSSAAISHDYDRQVTAEGLVSLVAIPVLVGQEVQAVLYGALREPDPIGDLAVDKLVAAAAQLSASLRAHRRSDDFVGAYSREAQPGLAPIFHEARALAEQVDDARLKSEILASCERYVRLTAGNRGQDSMHGLTRRELEVVALAAAGCSNREIAQILAVTIYSVKSYMRSAMQRLDARTRHGAVSAARANGLLP